MSVTSRAIRADICVPKGSCTKPSISSLMEMEHAFSRYLRHVDEGQDLAFEWDACGGIFHVVSGWLALSKSLPNGQAQIIDFVLPGDIVDMSAADGVTATAGIQAITNGSVAVIPNTAWETVLMNSPNLQQIVKNLNAARCARQAERTLRIGKGSAEARVAYALLEFCARTEACWDGEAAVVTHPLTQQMIGDFVGVSSVHVCRTMRQMVQMGILASTDHRVIRVCDVSALCKLASVDWSDLRQRILPRLVGGEVRRKS